MFQDRTAQLDVGGLDVGDKAHRQARKQAGLNPIQRLRCAIGRENQALAFGQQRIDRIKQFFLRITSYNVCYTKLLRVPD